MNYYDILLAKKLEDDRDPKVEGLSVTANGTYSEEGKVYNPVIVNVAGYSLEDMPSGDIASFTYGSNLPMPSLKVGIEPIQEGSGDPSPTNIRPISGWDEVNVVVSPTTDAEDGTTYNIQFKDGDNPLTVYGGTLDVVSGELVVDRIKWTLTPTASQIAGVDISDCIIFIPADKTPVDWNVSVNKCMCNKLKVSNYSAQHDNHIHFPNSSIIALFLEDEVGTTKQDWVDYLAQAQIDVSYIIATPLTIQLTPTAVKSLLGTNNIWADTGDVLGGSYFKEL